MLSFLACGCVFVHVYVPGVSYLKTRVAPLSPTAVCTPAYLSVRLSACLSLPGCLAAWLPACLACLPACLPCLCLPPCRSGGVLTDVATSRGGRRRLAPTSPASASSQWRATHWPGGNLCPPMAPCWTIST